MAGAGHGQYCDAFAQVINSGVLKDSAIGSDPKSVLERALEQFYQRKVIPFDGRREDERPDFSVVLGYPATGSFASMSLSLIPSFHGTVLQSLVLAN